SVALTYAFFFFDDTATTEIYTLSLHDALPISPCRARRAAARRRHGGRRGTHPATAVGAAARPGSEQSPADLGAAEGAAEPRAVRSEEHTSELQSLAYLVCRLLLEKKKRKQQDH